MGSYRRYLLTLAEHGCHLFDSFTLGGRTITVKFKRNPLFQGNWNEFKAQHTLGITGDETCVYSAEKISSTVLATTVEYIKTPKSPKTNPDFITMMLFSDKSTADTKKMRKL